MSSQIYGPGMPISDVVDYGDEYFRANYNTKLSPEDEMRFSAWLAESSKNQGRDISMDSYDYDIKGFWKNTQAGPLGKERSHGPDTYKKPNHPTFSSESIYHGKKSPFGGVYSGGTWLSDGSFAPSPSMLKTTHNKEWLEAYFSKYEKGTKIIYPRGY